MYRAVCVVGVSTMTLLLSACLQQQTTMGTAESPAQAAVEITQSKKPIYTTNLKISRAEIESYVDQVVLLKEHASLPFSKWVPAKGKYIYFGLYGLSPEQAVVFGTIVAEFAHRTKLPVRPYKKGVQISWLFSYLPDLGALERMPQLKRIYCHRDARGCPDPSSPFYIAKGYSMENGRVTPATYKYAGRLDPSLSGNALAARFVQDVMHAFIVDTSILYLEQESVVGFKTEPVVANGPVYSWRVPIMDLLYLHALYDPSIKPGIAREVAATQITELIVLDLQLPRRLYPDTIYMLGGLR